MTSISHFEFVLSAARRRSGAGFQHNSGHDTVGEFEAQ